MLKPIDQGFIDYRLAIGELVVQGINVAIYGYRHRELWDKDAEKKICDCVCHENTRVVNVETIQKYIQEHSTKRSIEVTLINEGCPGAGAGAE
jgi:hypothetical protein